ncbi:TrkA-N domain protein [Arcobacter nitrofigilis DSM 7299]|uniref:TrkA-N domain protein n=1 Tax=Arcobacter nitrofigilis (strain ATCC 33309 / DSM 7299 / CCUG 15893 / LMG 7604 / NCTC 12251 / CI) TaxID=572480 RepID=D5V0X9_ARCNC|nr:NAD-binding protein [Arcobacter nitrofigilis]ADG93941.1 TrkA-N domain protein [Arcobacter nitrofigilis DSM 7299]
MSNSTLWIVLLRMRMPFIVIIVTYTIAITGLLLIDGVDDKGNVYHMSIFDAYYFITYTATTIGFGETPYAFTYPQRMWVSFSIYLTVLGWFYGIGTLVSLLQDKVLLEELRRNKFRRNVKDIRQSFIIVLGYNNITSEIIKKALSYDIKTVVIESDESRVNDLLLENFTPYVPVLLSDVSSPKVLEEAGIEKSNCKGLVCLFNDDKLNLKIAVMAKLLNRNIKLVVKATTMNQGENLEDIGVDIVANPFSIISKEIDVAFKAPNILKLEKWIYKLDNLNAHTPNFPIGRYIICGFGRMGNYLHNRLSDNNIELVFIEIDEKKLVNYKEDSVSKIIIGDADDKKILTKAGILESVAIIAATNDDTTNLSILSSAKKLNPKIITIARENELGYISMFQNSRIDHVFLPANILINKTTNALINPLSDMFIQEMITKDEAWASSLVKRLTQTIDESPLLESIEIDNYDAPEIYKHLDNGEELKLKIFRTSLHNRELNNNVVPLALIRGDEKYLIPDWDMPLEKNDKILFACDKYARDDMQHIAQNIYEFYYAYSGKEKRTILRRILK